MRHTLKNDFLQVIVNTYGAEISSIRYNNLEYIWQADASIWARHAPVLFPIVGRLKDNHYSYKNKKYELHQHGFARDTEFDCVANSSSDVSFKLSDSNKSKDVFPFAFDLVISYTLIKKTIICNYTIINTSKEEDLFFSIGAHPGFKIPLDENENYGDYSLILEGSDTFKKTLLENGLLSDKKELISENKIPLSKDLFSSDAMIFENAQIKSASVISNVTKRGVKLTCENWPYFGIWSKKESEEFICLEPWHGITDSVYGNNLLEEKKGIIKLKANTKFDCHYAIECF